MSAPNPESLSRRPRLLVATNNRYWRANMGSHLRVAAMVRHFISSGWDVTVAFQGRPYADDARWVQGLDHRVVFSRPESVGGPACAAPAAAAPLPPLSRRLRETARHSQRWLRAAWSQVRDRREGLGISSWREVSLRARELQVQDGVDRQYLSLVEDLVLQAPPDVILVEYVVLAWLAPKLKPLMKRPALWLLDTHDVMHERQARFHAAGELHHLDISADQEAEWLRHFDGVLAIQDRDAEKFRAMDLAPTQVITVLHPMPAVAVPRTQGDGVVVGFLGSAMAPNARAVRELLDEVWPLVVAQVGGQAGLVIAGSVCSSTDLEQLPAGVSMLGHVDHLDEFYARVDVIASPIRVGGGLKIKNIEALCKGKALVTTAIGAEGMETAAGHAFQLAETPQAMAEALVHLIRDRLARDQQAARGIEYARTMFSEQAVFAALDAHLKSRAD